VRIFSLPHVAHSPSLRRSHPNPGPSSPPILFLDRSSSKRSRPGLWQTRRVPAPSWFVESDSPPGICVDKCRCTTGFEIMNARFLVRQSPYQCCGSGHFQMICACSSPRSTWTLLFVDRYMLFALRPPCSPV
jgi:hypothetical protein